MKFFDGSLGEILPTGNVDGGKPALFAPAPGRAGRDADLFHPFGQADDGPAMRLVLCRVCFHTRTLNARLETVSVLGQTTGKVVLIHILGFAPAFRFVMRPRPR